MAKWSSQNFGKYPDPWYKLRFKPPPDKKKKEKVKKVKEILKKEKEEPKVRRDYFSAFFQCCGFEMFIPDPNFFHPGSQIRIKEFKYFNPKNVLKALGCSFPDPDPVFYPSRIQGSKRHRIPDSDTQHCRQLLR
jgi:hypothetical protein